MFTVNDRTRQLLAAILAEQASQPHANDSELLATSIGQLFRQLVPADKHAGISMHAIDACVALASSLLTPALRAQRAAAWAAHTASLQPARLASIKRVAGSMQQATPAEQVQA